MTKENYRLTFSQREGKMPLPEAMKLEHVPQRFRQLAWNSVDKAINELASGFLAFDLDAYEPEKPIGAVTRGIPQIIRSYKFDILLKPHDEIRHPCPSEDRKFSRKIILFDEYHITITFIEYILRHKECTDVYIILWFLHSTRARQPISWKKSVICHALFHESAEKLARQLSKLLIQSAKAAWMERQHICAKQWSTLMPDDTPMQFPIVFMPLNLSPEKSIRSRARNYRMPWIPLSYQAC